MRSDGWRGFGIHTAAGLGGGVVVILLIVLSGFIPSPAPFLMLGVAVGGLVWLIRHTPESAPNPEWVLPRTPAHAAQFTADLSTRRLASMVANAQPGRAFTMGELADVLRERVSERLIRRGALAENPLADAAEQLSPQLHRYLLAENPSALHRRTLRTFLKEIEDL